MMTKEARQPSSYICLTAPRAQLLQCKEAWRDEDREEVRERERESENGGRERERNYRGRERVSGWWRGDGDEGDVKRRDYKE